MLDGCCGRFGRFGRFFSDLGAFGFSPEAALGGMNPEIERLREEALEAQLAFGCTARVWRDILMQNIGVKDRARRVILSNPWHRHVDRANEFERIRSIQDKDVQKFQHDALRRACDLFDNWRVLQNKLNEVDDQ
jgi:hypothetical protein